jgi:4-hydroxy-tetrahydrodipicolinate reductase
VAAKNLNVIVCGVGGRMGGAVVRAIQQTAGVDLIAGIDKPASPRLGRDVGELAAAGHLGIAVTDRIEPHLRPPNTVIIDFTQPQASLGYLRAAAKKSTPIVIATTGFNPRQSAEIKRLSRRAPTLLSANTSLGVNVLVSLLGKVAKMLGDYDVEIIETHHRFKKDAPSGTALALGRSVAGALGRNLDKVGIHGRKGIVGERSKRDIALLSVRAGDIVGEHTVIFGGIGERLEFTHRAHSRDTFAHGAIRAAQWLARQKPGLYRMQDVLEL